MKAIILILALSIGIAHAQPPFVMVDTNIVAESKARVAAFLLTNVPVPMRTNVFIVTTSAMAYPTNIPIGAWIMRSTNGTDWQFVQQFILNQTNSFAFTNYTPVSDTNIHAEFYQSVLVPPSIIAFTNQN